MAKRTETTAFLGALALTCASCGGVDGPTPPEDVGVVEAALVGDTDATSFFWSRSALLFDTCTGTKIAPRFVLTAAHCQIEKGHKVQFYTTGPDPTTSWSRTVSDVFERSGVDAANDDLSDSNGDFADLAVLQLNDAVDVGNVATLAWAQAPSVDHTGTKVGASSYVDDLGFIHPQPGPKHLEMTTDTISTDDSNGYFLTDHEQTRPGDSGGPIYFKNRVVGEVWGHVWIGSTGFDKYTSVPYYLNWILAKIGYQWPGETPVSGAAFNGPLIELVMTSSERVCQYACDHTSSCAAYTQSSGLPFCNLLSRVDSVSLDSNWKSGLK